MSAPRSRFDVATLDDLLREQRKTNELLERLVAREANAAPVAQSEEFLTPREVAALLHTSLSTIYDQMRERKLAFVQISKRMRKIKAADVEAFARRHRVEARPRRGGAS